MKISLIPALFALIATPAFAQSHADHSSHGATADAAVAATPLVHGEVRKVDPATNKVTLRHGPIPNLGMPPMTMVFQGRDADQIAGLAMGDKVRFSVVSERGALVLTSLERIQP